MKVHWQQFSPCEKEALLRHYILHRPDAQVSAQKVCEAMKETHFLSCVSPGGGPSIIGFIAEAPGAKPGMAIAEDISEGIYMAALRAHGVELVKESGEKKKQSGGARKLPRH